VECFSICRLISRVGGWSALVRRKYFHLPMLYEHSRRVTLLHVLFFQ